MKKILFLLTAIILLPLCMSAQYSGNLTANTTWGPGTITVTGNINANGYTLTILPGTTVRLNDNVGITVMGTSSRIIADGEENNPIIFEATYNGWNHIFIQGSTGNLFDHCNFMDGSDLINWPWKGGAIYLNLAAATLTNCSFSNNRAEMGGAVTAYQSEVEISDCEFFDNNAYRGGAIHIQEDLSPTTPQTTVTINRCKLYHNSATQTAAIHIANNSSAVIENSLIYNNISSTNGGIAANNFSGELGFVLLKNCVVANNRPNDFSFRGSYRTTAQNCIFWGSDQSVIYPLDDEPQQNNLVNCAVQGAWRNGEINIPVTFDASFQLNALNNAPDGPNFVSPLIDYNITYLSPCRDMGLATGAPTTDYLGNTRIGQYDIGAYEVHRQLLRWTGSISNDWSTPGNWSPADGVSPPIVPGVNDDVLILNTGNTPSVISSPAQCFNLIVEPLAGLTVNGSASLSVGGSIVVNSPATNVNGSVVNNGTVTGNVVYNRTIPDDGATQLWHYISSPVIPNNIVSDKEFYPWNEVAGDWGNPTTNISSGIGYTVIGGGSVSFIGSLQSSDFSVDATSPYNDVLSGTDYSGRTYVQGDGHSHATRSYTNYGGGGFNLLGNPFASALKITDSDGISSNDFLSANPGKFDPNYVAVYIYNGNSYGYIGNSTGWSTNNPSQLTGTNHVQVGQAFFVLAMNDYTTFTFNKEMQVHNTSVSLLKSTSSDIKWPGIQLKVKSAEKVASTLIVYDPEMSVGLDPGYDVGFISGGAEIEIYSALAADTRNVNYARQALPLTDIDSVIVPIGIDTRTGGEITFSAETVTFKSYRYLLEDRQTGTFIDISKRDYKTTVAPETFGTGRFYLHTAYADRRNTQPGLTDSESAQVRIWAYGHDVIIKGPLSAGALCEIFSLQGQEVLSTGLNDEELNTISIASHLKGTFLVRVTDGVKVHTAKIFIR